MKEEREKKREERRKRENRMPMSWGLARRVFKSRLALANERHDLKHDKAAKWLAKAEKPKWRPRKKSKPSNITGENNIIPPSDTVPWE
jgi:hypothetical protein